MQREKEGVYYQEWEKQEDMVSSWYSQICSYCGVEALCSPSNNWPRQPEARKSFTGLLSCSHQADIRMR